MLKRFVRFFGGDPNKKAIEKYSEIVEEVNALEAEYEAFSAEALRDKTDEFRSRLSQGETLDDLLPEAFAVVREASKRTLGMRHFDVQIIGGAVLHQGKIAEMRTGEGKTLVATLPLYLNALTGKGAHLITVNDYLARRDARWMAPIYNALGLSVGVLQMAARTENGKKAFIIDLEKESPHEDQHQLRMVPRAEAYAADITYGTNSEFGFDYLRDNMVMRWEDRVQRGHYFAIIDEVDNVLIDEARTPLIISGPAQDEAEWYIRTAQVVRQLRPEDYEVSEKDRSVTLTEVGEARVEELLGMVLRDPDRPEDATPEQLRMLGYLEQALRAQHLYRRNKEYLVQAGKVVIVDEFTGRLMPGRRWSDGLHQAVEAKEGVRVQEESVTYATITIQNYFRMYEKLAGMSGTALTEAEEFDKIYKLGVVAIPTNLEYSAALPSSGLVEVESRDDDGYKFAYYARQDDPQKIPAYWKRKDYPDVVYRTLEAKLREITREILQYHVIGRPVLVGTTSVELSDRVSSRLRADPLRRLAFVLILRHAWFEYHKREEDGRQIPELQFINIPLPDLDLAAMRKLARELDIATSPEDPANLDRLITLLGLSASDKPRLAATLQAGIPHEVLNARKHTEESQIIAGAGAFGAVTIATNMAGRGVDIKLGGELAEEVLADVARVLQRGGHEDPYNMTMEQRRQALLTMDPADYGIYEAEVKYFLQHMEDMEQVRARGGLHVVGSERHEARRIDNQLRGRSARQGDPGSSRFYLSMEDDLMRLFGGQQADGLMQRMKIDEALPLEVGLVGRIVEQSQTRVEGANFDVRKHLLEYDDVLNTQREKIYTQRNRIFLKDDLGEDVGEMLRTEVNQRVPESLKDDEGPWKLLAWLEQIQPPLQTGAGLYPSYMLLLLQESILQNQPGVSAAQARQALLDIIESSLSAEEEHLINTVNHLLDQTEQRLSGQIEERLEAIETFFDALAEADESDNRSPRQIADELAATARVSLRLTSEQIRAIKTDPESLSEEVRHQVRTQLSAQAIARLIGSIQLRLEEPLDVNPNDLLSDNWDDLATQVLDAIQAIYANRQERYLGAQGQIRRDLGNALPRDEQMLGAEALLQLLMALPLGARASFDKRTHRRVVQRTSRFTYLYYAASFLKDQEADQVTEHVLQHLEEAAKVIQAAWGASAWSRLANSPVEDLSRGTQNGLRNALGEQVYAQIAQGTLAELDGDLRPAVVSELGRQYLSEVYRQLLLSVITELWVDYLTQMEALRISIGLEAYAQRDPLVQYKSKAFGLFQDLLGNMRASVVNRMFTYRPREVAAIQPSGELAEAPPAEPGNGSQGNEAREEPEEDAEEVPAGVASRANSGSKNKRRRRRRH